MNHEEEIKMFGCTTKALANTKSDMISDLDYAVSILSDAQESLVLKVQGDQIRQMINRAKYFIRRNNK